MARIASFHLISEPMWKAPLAITRLGTDRPQLSQPNGLLFWRLLGTGRGSSTALGASLSRTAVFGVWEDESALDQFLLKSRIAERWQRAEELWSVRLRLLDGHGRWHGFDPLAGLQTATTDSSATPIVALTRAAVRRRSWWEFHKFGRMVSEEIQSASGLIDVLGFGEAPVGRLGTFSLWESAAAAEVFATSGPLHARAVSRTRAGGWFTEELFATFQPYAVSGTWNGRTLLDPDS